MLLLLHTQCWQHNHARAGTGELAGRRGCARGELDPAAGAHWRA
jgi:hypothetical protein